MTLCVRRKYFLKGCFHLYFFRFDQNESRFCQECFDHFYLVQMFWTFKSILQTFRKLYLLFSWPTHQFIRGTELCFIRLFGWFLHGIYWLWKMFSTFGAMSDMSIHLFDRWQRHFSILLPSNIRRQDLSLYSVKNYQGKDSMYFIVVNQCGHGRIRDSRK